ncbi:transcriptional regulator with XRE-family HTH domain [Oxalobacteraceae bacterium GrIS 1.11]
MKWYERLKTAREAKGLKKSHFAKAIGVQPPTITEWERGDTIAPSGTSVMNICRVLSITPEWLMEGPRPGDSSAARTYVGSNERIGQAVTLMESIPDYELDQILGIIETLANKAKGKPLSD